jgi:hypothetical protein
MEKEYLKYRFGFMAVKKGFATPEQVTKALEIQFEENLLSKKHRLIGEILIDMGFMNRSQVDEVLEEMSAKD